MKNTPKHLEGRVYACRDCGHTYGGPHIPSYRAIALHRAVSHRGAPVIVEVRA